MIYTFYSYKGGVGRSMALANVAECLYQRGARVLMVDWDLEAPGLEHFFYSADDSQIDRVRSRLGVIDMLLDYQRQYSLASLSSARRVQAEEKAGEDKTLATGVFERVKPQLLPLENYLFPIHPPEPRGDTQSRALWLFPSGWRSTGKPRQDTEESKDEHFSKYAQAVQSFDWADFYSSFEGQAYFEWLREQFLPFAPSSGPDGPGAGNRLGFDAVLIDSRTGVTEMGGVCTRQLADVVISFCATNYQNLDGVVRMTKSFLRKDIEKFRGGKKLEVVVVPSRVDLAGETTAQNRFRALFESRLKAPDLFQRLNLKMWDEMVVPYIVRYAYHEALAIGDPDANKAVEDAYWRLAARLALFSEKESRLRTCFATELRQLTRSVPEAATEATSAVEEVVLKASSTLVGFTAEEQATARRLFTRLVRVTPEASGDTRLRVKLNDLKMAGEPVLSKLMAAGVLKTQKDALTKEETVELIHDVLLHDWPILSAWLNQDREFLLWRLRLDAGISSWEQKFRDRDFLLRGKALTEARLWATKKPADLSPLELEFIEASGRDETAQMRSRRLVRVGAALTVSLFAWAVLGWWIWTYSNQYQIQQILSDAPVTAAASTGEDGTSAGIAWVKALRVAGKAGKADEALQAVLAGARQIRPLPAEASSPPAESQASVAPPGPAEFAQQYKKRQQATGRNSTPAVPAPVPSPVRRPKASPAPVDAQKPMALAMVAEELPPASASEVLSEARDLAGRVSLPRARAYVLSFMGTIYEKKGMPADAIQAFQSALSSASEVQDSYARAAILRDIAVDMAGSGLIDEALTRVVSQQDGEARTITLVSMASTLVKARKQPLVQKLVDQAAQSAEAIKDPFSKVRALCDVAVLMAQEKMNGANKLFQGAQDAAVLIRSPNLKASALKFISSALSSAGVNDLALKTFQEGSAIDRKSGNADAGGGKQEVLLLARASQSDDALAIMKVLVSRDSVGADVIPIVQELCTSGRCQQALAAVSGSMTDANFAGSFCSAAPGFADADKATAKAVLSFVESAGPNLHDVANRSYCLNSLGQGWLQVGENGRAKADFNEASKLAGGILNPNYKSTALSGAAQGLAAVHEYRQARLNSAPCSAVDQLRAYTAILTAYAAQ